MKDTGYRGFTLIELVMVIAVISILSAVAIPKWRGFTTHARSNQAMGDVVSLKTAIQMYHHDTGTYPGGTADVTSVSGLNGYLVSNPGVGGWNGPYCERVQADPWGNSYQFYNKFGESCYSCVMSFGPDKSRNSSLSSGATCGDDLVAWME